MRRAAILWFCLSFVGCGGDDGTRPSEGTLELAAEGTVAHAGVVAEPLASPLTVRVTRDGKPVAGMSVRWSAFGGSVSDSVTLSDAQGLTSTLWTLGTTAGRQTVRATLKSGGAMVEFTADALAGAPVQLTLVGDTLRRVGVNSTTALELSMTDAHGNRVDDANPAPQWKADDPSIASVDASGQVQAHRRGETRVHATVGAHTVSVRFRTYEMLFADQPGFSLGGNRHMEVRAADFDGDGDLDLIVAREFQTNLLLLNDGAGNFVPANDRIPQKVRDSEDIAVGDFDRDGDLDIVIVSEDDVANPQIALVHEYYLNDGTGHFTDVSERIPVRSESNAVVAGDIDGDGDLDLILSSPGREIVLINDGKGFFTDESAARMPSANDGTQDVALGDVDGDGDLDLLVGNDAGDRTNKLYLNNGAGFFTLTTNIPPRAAEVTRNADFGDVDGDGDLDIYFANATYDGGNPQDRLLLNDGKGIFTDVTGTHLPVITAATFDADFVDVDGDGDLDIVAVGNRGSEAGFIFLNEGGRFVELTPLLMPFVAGGIVIEVEAFDANSDGKLDLLFSGYNAPHRLLFGK